MRREWLKAPQGTLVAGGRYLGTQSCIFRGTLVARAVSCKGRSASLKRESFPSTVLFPGESFDGGRPPHWLFPHCNLWGVIIGSRPASGQRASAPAPSRLGGGGEGSGQRGEGSISDFAPW
eukprot:scaffold152585_cov22-Tisochrysis_lutea.AAC.1